MSSALTTCNAALSRARSAVTEKKKNSQPRSFSSAARVIASNKAQSFKTSNKNGRRSGSLIVKAADKFDAKEVVKSVSDKWEETENKGQVITYVAGATAVLWLSSTVVGAINAIPLMPKIMELVGLGYSAWFVYRYVLFKDSRKELQQAIDDLLAKVSDI